jgi:hypothetical protein
VVLAQELRVFVPELLEQPGRAFDVGEEEGHGPGGESSRGAQQFGDGGISWDGSGVIGMLIGRPEGVNASRARGRPVARTGTKRARLGRALCKSRACATQRTVARRKSQRPSEESR